MTDRPILRLPDSRPARRIRGRAALFPRPRSVGRRRQGERFRQEFDRIQAALARDDAALVLRRDPFGIAPERALVFVTAVAITDFARAARLVGLEVLSEIELEDNNDLPNDLIVEHGAAVNLRIGFLTPEAGETAWGWAADRFSGLSGPLPR